MSKLLQLDTGVLRAAATRLAAEGSTLDGVTASSVASRHGQYGNAVLSRATEQLAARWATGLSALSADVRAAGSALTQTADTFAAVDASAASTARELVP